MPRTVSANEANEDRARRQAVLARLEALREEVQASGEPVTEAQAWEIADQLTRAAVQSLDEKGKIKFAP